MQHFKTAGDALEMSRPCDRLAEEPPRHSPDETRKRVMLSAVVVTFNRREQIKKTVARLLDEDCDRIHLIDNGSTDGTREWLATLSDPRVNVINAPGNLGGAGGFELGLRKAVELDDPDWLVIMDDDARPDPGCLRAFREQDLDRWDAISTAVYMKDGQICDLNRPTINPFWHFPTFLRTLAGSCIGKSRGAFHLSDDAYEAGPMEIDATSFVGLFISRRAIERAGYPDGSLFIYGDDVLYTLGLSKAGLQLGFLPELRFEHEYNAATGGNAKCFTPIWKAYYTARNGLLVYRFAAGLLFWPAFLLILVKWLTAGRHYGDGRRTYYRMLWHGVKDGIVGKRSRPHNEVMAIAD